MPVEYKIIRALVPQDLDRLVNQDLRDGWELYGSPGIFAQNGVLQLIQAVTRSVADKQPKPRGKDKLDHKRPKDIRYDDLAPHLEGVQIIDLPHLFVSVFETPVGSLTPAHRTAIRKLLRANDWIEQGDRFSWARNPAQKVK